MTSEARGARPRLRAPREEPDLARVQSMVLRIRGAQMRGANRIDELQDSHDGHEAKLLELGETLSRIEAKLDRILDPDQPD